MLTQFDVLYERSKTVGISDKELPELAVIYYAAVELFSEYEVERKAENERLANIASTVAAVVATVGVTMIVGPVATATVLGALGTGTTAGSAAAAAGAAVRHDNSRRSVTKDFFTGFVDGFAGAAGSNLAAKAAVRLSKGSAAGIAATKIGGAAGARANLPVAIIEAAIDGAIGGAAGELFQTAADEALWDRSVSQIIAKLLAAAARGAAMGAGVGGVVGGGVNIAGRVAKTFARQAAHLGPHRSHLAKLTEEKVLALPPAFQHTLDKAATQLNAGDHKGAERLLQSTDDLPQTHPVQADEVARTAAASAHSDGAAIAPRSHEATRGQQVGDTSQDLSNQVDRAHDRSRPITRIAANGGATLAQQRELARLTVQARQELTSDFDLLLEHLSPAQVDAIAAEPWRMRLYFGTAVETRIAAMMQAAVSANPEHVLANLRWTGRTNAPADFLAPDNFGFDITGNSVTSIVRHSSRPEVDAVVTYESIPNDLGLLFIRWLSGG